MIFVLGFIISLMLMEYSSIKFIENKEIYPPIVPIFPRQTKEPGDQVVWHHYPVQKTKKNEKWGKVLTDIEEHLPAYLGNQYFDSDANTHGHETTHGIHSDIRNNHTEDRGSKSNGLYCLNNKAAIVRNPNVKIHQVAPLVPKCLHGSRYNLYLVQQAKSWDDTPTYIFDEWTAYINGSEVDLDQFHSGLSGGMNRKNDSAIGPLEFSYYTLALCLAVEKHDPEYMDSPHFTQFKEFVAHELKRSFRVYTESIKIDYLNWETNLVSDFVNHHDAEPLRNIAMKWYGEPFVKKYLKHAF